MTCRRCGKPTYSGCGAHAEQVLAGVPKDMRCACRQQESTRDEPRGPRWWPF